MVVEILESYVKFVISKMLLGIYMKNFFTLFFMTLFVLSMVSCSTEDENSDTEDCLAISRQPSYAESIEDEYSNTEVCLASND